MSIFYQERLDDFQLKLSYNNSFSPHLHRQIELILVVDGGIQVTIDKDILFLKPGEGCLIFPNQIHSLHTPSSSRILLFIFDTSFCPGYKNDFLTRIPASPILYTDRLTALGRDALQTLCQLWILPSVFPFSFSVHSQYTIGFLHSLLTDLFSRLTLHARTGASDLELSQHILLYVEAHCTEPLTLASLSAYFHVSRFTISRIFSEKLHTSFPSFLTSWRLEKAKDLLLNETSLSVTDIAYEAGFLSTRTFFRTFCEAYGISPRVFRSQTPKK